MNKKRLIFIIAAVIIATTLVGCTAFKSENTDGKNDISVSDGNKNTKKDENSTNTEKDIKNDASEKTENGINAGKGPVAEIPTEGDITEKIEKFNTLEDGNYEKEKIREELEALFEYAEGKTIE